MDKSLTSQRLTHTVMHTIAFPTFVDYVGILWILPTSALAMIGLVWRVMVLPKALSEVKLVIEPVGEGVRHFWT